MSTLQAEFVPTDIEALRSLLDSALSHIRDRYLYLSDNEKNEREIAKSVVIFLEDRRVLYNTSELELPNRCLSSVVEIRRFLTEKITELDQDSELAKNLKAMRAACRKFLDTAESLHLDRVLTLSNMNYNAWVFIGSLGEMRGTFGMCLSQIVLAYGFDIEKNLASILPASDKD